MDRSQRMIGLLLGTAVGDALGLPFEGISAGRVARMLRGRPLGHRLLLGRGLLSDDTEHACMTAQALLASDCDTKRFAHSLAWRLRGWLMALPPAIGWGTLRSIVKLWLGFGPRRSGVWSAGNGAAMRAPVIGACLAHDLSRLRDTVAASTRMTHSDPRAAAGALAIALAARAAMSDSRVHVSAVLEVIRQEVDDAELLVSIACVERHLARNSSPLDVACELGLEDGVTGYIHHTVPMVLFCWLRYRGDFVGAVEATVRLGGDTDTTAALVGALAGAEVGVCGIPPAWSTGIADWPRSRGWLHRLGARLAAAFPSDSLPPSQRSHGEPIFWPMLPIRNLLFLVIVLVMVGFRRALPPY